MNKQQTIIINGVGYDAHTGMRMEQVNTPVTTPKQPVVSKAIHTQTQRSKTLARKHVQSGQPKSVHRPSLDGVRRSPQITKFAAQPQITTQDKDIVAAPITHPIQHAVRQKSVSAAAPISPPTPQHLKAKAIENAMNASGGSHAPKEKRTFFQKHTRGLSVAGASLATIMVAGYLTYTNLPSLSVRIASTQAGVDATYPTYQPSGYSLNGPVAFDSGEVSMKFAANAGPQEFTVEQSKTNWDSSALLENLVKAQAKDDYETYSDSGLTIYVYGTNAAWVNGGVLHTIEGDAPLTNDQIRRIATSM